MTIVVTLDSTFNTLNNGGQRLRIRQNTPTREREAIVNVTFSNSQSLASGLVAVDFSKIRGFTKVYTATIINSPLTSGHVTFIRASDDSAETGEFLFLDEALAALVNAPDETYDVVIRGV